MARLLEFNGDRIGPARLEPGARLRFDGVIARAGASIELDLEQHIQRLETRDEQRQRVRRSKGWRRVAGEIALAFGRAIDALRLNWLAEFLDLGLGRRGALISGEDSDDAEALSIAAADYNRLRDFFRAQPSTDAHEDECNFKYHDLRRRARYLRMRSELDEHTKNAAVVSWMTFLWMAFLYRQPAVFGRQVARRVDVSRALQCERFVCFVDWFVKRNALGYLIRWPRILISGGAIMLAFALLYLLGASADTLTEIARGEIDALSLWNALYFSVLTFTTLSYGDLHPVGWFKIATAAEALLGVAWIALFIVSWTRKMVR